MNVYNINLRNVVLPNGKELKNVTYQISKGGKFNQNDIVNTIVKDTEEMTNLDVELDFTNVDVYYIRVKLIFTDDSFKGWLKPLVITKQGDTFASNDAVIVTPEINITTDNNQAELGNFFIEGSDFILFSGNGYHKYSNYIIRDFENKIAWSKIRDKKHLNKIRVPAYALRSGMLYTVEVTYICSNGMVSNAGKQLMVTKGKLSTECASMLDSVGNVSDVEKDGLEEVLNDVLNRYANCLAINDERRVYLGDQ